MEVNRHIPEAFLARMRRMLDEEEYKAFLSSYGQERRFSLRVNTLKCTRERFLALAGSIRLPEDSAAASGEYTKKGGTSEKSTEKTVTSEENPEETAGQSPVTELLPEGPMTEKSAPEKLTDGELTRTFPSEDSSNSLQNDPHGLLRPVPWEADGFYYPENLRPGRLPWHEAGMYYIQEASAMAPAVLCGVIPGERVLDLCAAPGGKSTKLAASLQGEGLLVSNEIHPERARILASNMERMGARNVLVTSESPQSLSSRFPVYFDRIVVDAPCSGEGMFRKEEEALLQWSEENVTACAVRQKEILEEAASMLRPGGTLVYSTCTFAPEENEGVIADFLQRHPDFSVSDPWESPGLEPDKWGFARGRVEWIGDHSGALEAHAAVSDGIARQLAKTIRLWPHRLSGEGHFAAVLKKEANLRTADRAATAAEERPAVISRVEEQPAVISRVEERTESLSHGEERPESLSHGEEQPESFFRLEGSRREKKQKKDRYSGKDRRREKTGKRGKSSDPAFLQVMTLWEDFCRENLTAPREDFPEENLLLFGENLYRLPLPARDLPLDGLRVLRPGLELGTVRKGRFVPAHALAMALHPRDVFRMASLSGPDREAFAWIRGEAVRAPVFRAETPAGAGRDALPEGPGSIGHDTLPEDPGSIGRDMLPEDPGSIGGNVLTEAPAETGRDRLSMAPGSVGRELLQEKGKGTELSSKKKKGSGGWVLVTIDGCSIGWGRASGPADGVSEYLIKNHYPKGLRRSWTQTDNPRIQT